MTGSDKYEGMMEEEITEKEIMEEEITEQIAEQMKACWNCLHEYTCDWELSGNGWNCPQWQPERRSESCKKKY